MYAILIVHPLQPGLLATERPRVLAASNPWQAFLSRQPGFREYLVLADPTTDRMVALTIWESEGDFLAALNHPDREAAGAALLALFAAPSAPETFEVLAHEHA